EAATEAEAAYQIATDRYQGGGISQIALLDAQRQQLQTALDRSTSAANRFADSATLLQALGGGWWNEQKPANTAPAPSPKAPYQLVSHRNASLTHLPIPFNCLHFSSSWRKMSASQKPTGRQSELQLKTRCSSLTAGVFSGRSREDARCAAR